MTPAQTIVAALDAVRITDRDYAALHPTTRRRVVEWRHQARAETEGRPYKPTTRLSPPTDADARRVVDVCTTLAEEAAVTLKGLRRAAS